MEGGGELPPARNTSPHAVIDIDYLKSRPGLTKIAEIMCLLIAFASLSGYTGSHKDARFGSRFDFFYFVTITSWLIIIAVFLLFLFKVYNRLNINWNVVLVVYCTVTAFMLLVSSALVLDAVVHHRTRKESEEIVNGHWTNFCSLEKCGNIEAAGAFGIIATALFIVDAVFYFIENRRGREAPPPGAEQF
ncbi:uncharacterized protein LOC5518062 [Nematostella vectensis]|uniref:uncharacterized protein LOC5518062 n=1 Tax=Nematostella vectensis TaxID=45351 RepID=UPI0020775333|nr:uncharacterized protein LOC5518062 [Nematostella vectensis]XP_048576847.1 uncharacterized protein LOC5518062 [Nematostella vectensis]